MSVTWLHISDFHVRGGDPYDRDVVLRSLVKSVGEYRKRGRAPDVIFATGDIALAARLSAEWPLISSAMWPNLADREEASDAVA